MWKAASGGLRSKAWLPAILFNENVYEKGIYVETRVVGELGKSSAELLGDEDSNDATYGLSTMGHGPCFRLTKWPRHTTNP